jgi:hypothetical protein
MQPSLAQQTPRDTTQATLARQDIEPRSGIAAD